MTVSAARNPKKEFSDCLKKDGFVWMSNEKFTTTRLYNKYSGNYPANDYVPMEYARFCKLEMMPSEDKISAYIKASLELVTGVVFIPNGPDIIHRHGSKWINTYRDYKPLAQPTDIDLFKEYLFRLFPDAEDYSICVSWLSHMFQRPEERPSWHLMLSSEVGTGKGFLVQSILNPLLSNQSSVINNFNSVTGKFSTVLSNNMLVLLDDPKSNSDSTATQLKSLLSEERAFIEPKGLTGGMVSTYTRFILASNENRPLRLDGDERRWYVPKRLSHKSSKEETQEFITRLAAALETPGYLDSIFHFFMEFDISRFNHKHVAQSQALMEMIGLSENSSDYVFSDFVEDHQFFTQEEIKAAFELEDMSVPSDAYIVHALGGLGFLKKQFRNDGGSKSRVWCKKMATQSDYNRHLEKIAPPAGQLF
jgi:hypothetical protein